MFWNKRGASFGSIVATIGAILIGVGVAWLIAMNWHVIPSLLKVMILLFSTALAYVIGVLFRMHEHRGIGGSLLMLGSLLYTLSIFLIAQIYSTSVSLQGLAFLWLLAWVGVIAASYIFGSSVSLVIGLGEFLIWISFQYFAFVEVSSSEFSLGFLAVLYLLSGVLFYGLNLLHKSGTHGFAQLYSWWSIFYFLVFAYILSFQLLLPILWPNGIIFSSSSLIFVIIFSVISIGIFAIGAVIAFNNRTVKGIEILGFIAITILFAVIIISASFVSSSLGSCITKSCRDLETQNSCEKVEIPNSYCIWEQENCIQDSCYRYNKDENSCKNALKELKCVWSNESYGQCDPNVTYAEQAEVYRTGIDKNCGKYDNNREACLSEDICGWSAGGMYYGLFGRGRLVPFNLWAMWIFDNIIFILFILGVIGYGTKNKSPKIANLGIIFFALDIIIWYLGFVFDFWGFTSLSILFIIGGIILIFGGWLIEKWRRRLIEQAKENSVNT